MVIGVTGGVGSGKSTVLELLKTEYQAYVIESDRCGHEVMQKGTAVYRKIAETFGDGILKKDGEIDRKALGSIVFSDEEKRKMLNGLTHPAIRELIRDKIHEAKKRGEPFIVLESALFIEAGYREFCDELWYIYAAQDIRIQRLMASRGYTRQKCLKIMKTQLDEKEFERYADRKIDNSKSPEDTKRQIDSIINYRY